MVSSYEQIFSSFYQLRYIDSFERGNMWGDDGENFKNFSKEINYNQIQNAANHPLDRIILIFILNKNPEYNSFYERSNPIYRNPEVGLEEFIRDEIGADVEIEVK